MASTFKLKAFKKTISVLNTAEQLTTVATAILGRFAASAILYAPSGNSATVYIGDSTVSNTQGFPLIAGSSVNIGDLMRAGGHREFDLSAIYVYGAANDVVHVLQPLEV